MTKILYRGDTTKISCDKIVFKRMLQKVSKCHLVEMIKIAYSWKNFLLIVKQEQK